MDMGEAGFRVGQVWRGQQDRRDVWRSLHVLCPHPFRMRNQTLIWDRFGNQQRSLKTLNSSHFGEADDGQAQRSGDHEKRLDRVRVDDGDQTSGDR